MKIYNFAASLAILATQTYALFEGVERLDMNNWAEKIEGDEENAWMVTFYADWCPHCKPFSEIFADASNDSSVQDKKVKFGAVDVMANKQLTTRFGIKRSPTVKMFGNDKFSPDDYIGHRKKDELVDFVNKYAHENDFIVSQEQPSTSTSTESETKQVGA